MVEVEVQIQIQVQIQIAREVYFGKLEGWKVEIGKVALSANLSLPSAGIGCPVSKGS